MPSKVDENLVFLYRCLVNSDCKTIDFNAVGVATNLKAPAARMRYSRLKKNLETKLSGGSEEVPVTSSEAPAVSAISLNTKKITGGRGSSKKRKITHENEVEESHVHTHDDKIDSATIKDEEFQEWRAGPRTRGKKIDLREAFDSDSDSLSGLGIRYEDDDYDMEDVSEDEEEFSAGEVEDYDDDQPESRRRKSSSQSAKRKMNNAKSTKTTLKNSSKEIVYPALNDAIKNGSNQDEPVTPERGLPSRSDSNGKGKSVTLPPTPQSMSMRAIKQKPMDSTSTVLRTRPDTPLLSPAARLRIRRNASPQPSLFDRIENARIQADYNLASLY